MTLLKIITLACLLTNGLATAAEPLSLHSESGETLMFHRLNNGELWGSFMITDQIADSFADYELIVLQVDHNKPIKLDQAKRCGGGKAETTQQVTYAFDTQKSQEEWQFKQAEKVKPNILKLAGWDKDIYQHMTSDRRPEVVDFPIQGALAIDSLWQQFKHGRSVVFRYTATDGQLHQAKFILSESISKLDKH
jgi:hypothetical protein